MSDPTIDFFKGRRLVIATKHKKEDIIGPLLEESLGVQCFVNAQFDSDQFGTFTGEIKRETNSLATARRKCIAAMELSNCDLGIASEGSFGPHPSIFLLNSDHEIVILMDKKNNLEVIAQEISADTNLAGKEIKNEGELKKFAKQLKFPSHGMILRDSIHSNHRLIKGISNDQDLKNAFKEIKKQFGSVYAESDMRALYNPSRMKAISIVTCELIKNLQSACPSCHTPGFVISDAKIGLPCSWCELPTNSVLSYIYTCQRCQYSKEQLYPNNKETEDPGYCNYCNP